MNLTPSWLRKTSPRLLLAMLVGLACIVGFTLIAVAVVGGRFSALDEVVVGPISRLESHGLTVTMRVISATVSAPAGSAIGVLVCLYFALRIEWYRRYLAPLITVGTGFAAGHLMKLIFAIPRPPIAERLANATGYTFPSGHTFTAFLYAGIIAWYIRHAVTGKRRVWLQLLPVLWASTVGFSRLYLRVHYFSDVIASFLFATLLLCAMYSELYIRKPLE